MRLGETLVNAGKITPAQLDETLKSQAIFGGRFGTNLIELGFLDEQELALFLSRKTGIQHATPEQLMDVPPYVTKLIPEEYVRKYRVMPIGVNNRKLTLAMVDPTDFAVIDEISFATGYIVVPIIAPELRMVTAMEKHYGIKRVVRYISVEGASRNRSQMRHTPPPHLTSPPAQPKKEEEWLAPHEAETLELPLLEEIECLSDMDELRELGAQPLCTEQPVSHEPQQEPEPDYSLEGVVNGLAHAEHRDDIADLISGHLAQQFDRVALFLLKGGKGNGWVAQLNQKPVLGFEGFEVPLSEPSVLKLVDESKSYYLGPLPPTPANRQMVEALGGGTPINNLLVPLMMMGRVVAVLYVEGGKTPLDRVLPELQKLVGKASMAFEILILKSKILMT